MKPAVYCSHDDVLTQDTALIILHTHIRKFVPYTKRTSGNGIEGVPIVETVPVTGARTQVGRSVKRVEDARLLTGNGRFIDDLEPVADIAHAAILRSTQAHAHIASVDVTAARESPGVLGVLAGEDVRRLSNPFPLAVSAPVNYYSLAVDKVRYLGEPVAVVVAENRYAAEDAAELIEVEYEPLPAVLDPEETLKPDAPLLHDDAGSNVGNHRSF